MGRWRRSGRSRLCAQVADALDFAHERGLVHRDVKPSNVLIDARDHVYLADFGLTKRLAEPGVVEPGLFGTIDYVAPEQIRGEGVDGRADVYSLGCLLCECLTGEPPFARSTDAAVLFAHLEEEPAAPPGLEEVIVKALAKEPDDRYGTCSELVDAAREALGVGEAKRDRRPLGLAAAGVALSWPAWLFSSLRAPAALPRPPETGCSRGSTLRRRRSPGRCGWAPVRLRWPSAAAGLGGDPCRFQSLAGRPEDAELDEDRRERNPARRCGGQQRTGLCRQCLGHTLAAAT